MNALMTEMDLSLGEGKLLRIISKKTFPACFPDLLLFRLTAGEEDIKKMVVKKSDVFEREKIISNIADNIITFIHTEIFIE